MTKNELIELALEALKHTHPSALTSFYTIGDRDKAIKAIQEHLAQPEQEPVAVVQDLDEVKRKHLVYEHGFDWKDPLYTTPPQRKPLTDEEIYSITGVENRDEMMHRMARNIARAIEAAHGIKGEA